MYMGALIPCMTGEVSSTTLLKYCSHTVMQVWGSEKLLTAWWTWVQKTRGRRKYTSPPSRADGQKIRMVPFILCFESIHILWIVQLGEAALVLWSYLKIQSGQQNLLIIWQHNRQPVSLPGSPKSEQFSHCTELQGLQISSPGSSRVDHWCKL